VVIGPHWLDISSGFGRRRLDDPGDFVRVEIETALKFGVPVIPVLVEGAKLPPARRLPPALRPLLEQNAVELRPDPDFSRDLERITAAVDYWQAQPRRPAPVAERPTHRDETPPPTPDAAEDTPELRRSRVATAGHAPSSKASARLSTSRRAAGWAAAALTLAVVVALVVVLKLPHGAGAASLTPAQARATALADTHATATAQWHALETQGAIASNAKPIPLGYRSANPGCDTRYWVPPLSAKSTCATTDMSLAGVDNSYDAANANVSETRQYFTARITVSNLQGGCAITLRGDQQTLTIALQGQSTDTRWSVETSTATFTSDASQTSGTIPTASSYAIVMQMTQNPDANPNDLALSINGMALRTTGKINITSSGAAYSYDLGLLQNVALSLYSNGAQSSTNGHATATFSDFSLADS
jgi:hypothetical protein